MAHDLAKEICEQEGVKYEDTYCIAKALLNRYGSGQAYASEQLLDEDAIVKQKQSIRRRYINIMKNRMNCGKKECREFIWSVVRAQWFMEKAKMTLDKIAYMVDGIVDDTAYDPEKDRDLEGKLLKTIIDKAYLRGKNNAKSDESIYIDLEIPRSTYFKKKKDAIVLFGVLMLSYAKRRERQDIESGILTEDN